MTRLESGAVAPHLELIDLADVVGQRAAPRRAAADASSRHAGAGTATADARLDPVLFEQVLFNLLDNAAKYTPPDTSIILRARREGDMVRIRILDEGDGLPESDWNACSTNSTGFTPATASAPAPGWG